MFSHIQKRLGQRSVFMMVISLFFLITIPIYILGFGIYHWGYQTMKREITSGLKLYLNEAQLTLEGEVERIRQLQFSCLNDEDLFYTINAENIMTPFERSQSLLRMQHRLEVLQESSVYIDDVKACLIRTGRMVSAQKGVEPLGGNWKDILYAPVDLAESRITYLKDRLYLCASYPTISPDPDVEPLYTLLISLNMDTLRQRLLSFNSYEDGTAAFYNGQNNWLMQKGSAELAGQIVSSPEVLGALVEGQSQRVSHQGMNYLAVGSHSEYLNMSFFSCVAEEDVFGGLWHYRMLFSVFFLVMLVVAGTFSVGSYYLIRRPMKRLVKSLRKVEKGDLSIRIQHKMNDEYAYLYDTFNSMADALENLIEMNYKQTLLAQQAQMRQLQTQINPHFLYNSFFTLYRMTKDEDYESVTEFLEYLSNYYHYITRDARQEVTLREDIAHAENYAHIQQIRFARRIRVLLDDPPAAAQTMEVPRLIVQPLLENAFAHGLKDVDEGGMLHLSYQHTPDGLCICVENNGADLDPGSLEELRARMDDPSANVEVTGLINIHRRMRLRFGERAGVRVEAREGGGVRVKLFIPDKEERHVSDSDRG